MCVRSPRHTPYALYYSAVVVFFYCPLGSKILTFINATLEHSAREHRCDGVNCGVTRLGFQTAAAEWWTLAYSDYFVVTKDSGYGRSAAFRAMKADKMYTVHKTNIVCDSKSATDFYDIQYHWSGI